MYANSRWQSAVDAGKEHDKHGRQSSPTHDSRGYLASEAEKAAGYSVEISPGGIQKARDMEPDDELQKKANEFQGYMKQLENAREQGEAAVDSARIIIKCLQIAMRIINGDEVPREDHEFLAKHNPELYAEAILRRMPKEDPHKYDRLSEDEKLDNPVNADDLTHLIVGSLHGLVLGSIPNEN